MIEQTIDSNTHIHPDAIIHPYAVIQNSSIHANATIGNYTLVRDSTIEEDCVVGAHAEIARSTFHKESGMHSGYVGDSEIGAGTRLGAGTIIANNRLDDAPGENRDGATIGERVRTGVNCSIMPGVRIGDDVVIGPGTIVMDDVSPGTRVYVSQEHQRTQ